MVELTAQGCVAHAFFLEGRNVDLVAFGFPTAGGMWGGGLLFRWWAHPGLVYFTLHQRITQVLTL